MPALNFVEGGCELVNDLTAQGKGGALGIVSVVALADPMSWTDFQTKSSRGKVKQHQKRIPTYSLATSRKEDRGRTDPVIGLD